MFAMSDFNGQNGDLNKWNVSSVNNMKGMFFKSNFNRDISKWNITSVKNFDNIFFDCPIKEEYKPKFNK